jgi:hypothetical protein
MFPRLFGSVVARIFNRARKLQVPCHKFLSSIRERWIGKSGTIENGRILWSRERADAHASGICSIVDAAAARRHPPAAFCTRVGECIRIHAWLASPTS